MQIDPTALPDVLILTPRRFGDARGWFMETWNAARMADAGLDLPWVQDNLSKIIWAMIIVPGLIAMFGAWRASRAEAKSPA